MRRRTSRGTLTTLLLVYGFGAVMLPAPSLAQTVSTFLGGSGTSATSREGWTTSGNWDPTGVPEGQDVWAEIGPNRSVPDEGNRLRIFYPSSTLGSDNTLTIGAISFLETLSSPDATYEVQNNASTSTPGRKGFLEFYGVEATIGGQQRTVILEQNSTLVDDVAFTQALSGQEFVLATSGAISVVDGASLTLSTKITEDLTPRSITKIGPGTLSLANIRGLGNESSDSTYTGGFTLEEGTVQWDLSGAAGVGTPFGLGPLTLQGGTLRATTVVSRSVNVDVVLDGGVTLGSQEGEFTGNVSINSNGGLLTTTVLSDSVVTVPAPADRRSIWFQAMSGTGQVTKAGDGILQLARPGTFTGGFVLDGGTVQWQQSGTAGVETPFGLDALTIKQGTLRSTTETGRSINVDVVLDGSVTLGSTELGNEGNITVNSNGGLLATTIASDSRVAVVEGGLTVWNQATSGPGGLTKAGPGTLRFSGFGGNAAHQGPTVVEAGTLVMDADLLSPATVSVLSGGTLEGSGTISGETTVDAGGTLSPGTGPGTISFAGDLILAGGGNYNFQIADATGIPGLITGWDLADVAGSLEINATAGSPFAINAWSLAGVDPQVSGDALNFSPTQSYSWTIASAAGGITGFSADAFVVNVAATNGTDGFSNAIGTGSFSVAVSGNDLNLLFTPGGTPTGIVIDVPSGSQTQAEAGYPSIATASSVTKIGAGTVVMDAVNTYTGPTTVSAGTLEVATGQALAATAVTVDTGATLSIAAGTTMQSPSVIVDGGTLSAASVAVDAATGIASLAINAGGIAGSPAVSVANGGELALVQDARVSVAVGSLAVDEGGGGGKVDLGAGQVAIDAGGISAADLRADIIAGRNGGAWNGSTGITSSAAAAAGGARAVGYVVNADSSVTVSFAAPGDTDLSGQVNVFDLIGIDAAGKFGNGQVADWSQGDFNYDGVANVFDLIGIDSSGAYGAGPYFPAAPSAAAITAVPEPALPAAALAVLAAAAVAARRLPIHRGPPVPETLRDSEVS